MSQIRILLQTSQLSTDSTPWYKYFCLIALKCFEACVYTWQVHYNADPDPSDFCKYCCVHQALFTTPTNFPTRKLLPDYPDPPMYLHLRSILTAILKINENPRNTLSQLSFLANLFMHALYTQELFHIQRWNLPKLPFNLSVIVPQAKPSSRSPSMEEKRNCSLCPPFSFALTCLWF